MRVVIVAILAAFVFAPSAGSAPNVEGYITHYAQQQAAAHGWTGYEWQAIDTIVTRESTWNPCRHYPSTTDCGYTGSNACGIPQRNPCPAAWRGRLWSTWKAQVRELMRYIRDRYGSPHRALEVWNVQGSY